MNALSTFLLRRRGGAGWHWMDMLAYVWLGLGLVLMFGPALWLVVSSFKTQATLAEFPPTLLPLDTKAAVVQGYDKPLPLYRVTREDGIEKVLAQVRRVGIMAQMVNPQSPGPVIRVPIDKREPVREASLATENYAEPLQQFDFMRYFQNSIFVTVMATLITLVVNSMAAFALSKYELEGHTAVLGIILATLYLVVNSLNLFDTLWCVILPTVATPTGVFLLRQYMLTIPDELIDAARMDKASEWQIYWRIVLPLAAPALAVPAIFSVMWRWNDFLWPLIVFSRKEHYTLQVRLNAFSGELNVQWHYVLAMPVLSIVPVALIFLFLRRYITAGIANTGLK